LSLVSHASGTISYLRDSLVNFVTGLGTSKDPRVSTHYHYSWIDRNVLEKMYRTDWLARKIVDAPAEDATREWRTWLVEKSDVAKIEKIEQAFQVQRKMREALIRARLYGGAALVLGVDQGMPWEELDLTKIEKGALKFVVVLNRYELNAGPRIYNVDSPYYTRPEYYTVATPMFGFYGEEGGSAPANNNLPRPGGIAENYPYGQSPPARSYIAGPGQERNRMEAYASPGLIGIHPSRVVEFSGNELPDWRLAPMGGGWGDPVLQTCEDALKDFGMTIAGLAALINDMKMDVVSVPNLSRALSTPETSSKLLTRFTAANAAKSAINTLLLDEAEKWERVTTSFGSTPELINAIMQVACAAGGIPVSRAMGSAPSKGLDSKGGSGGEVDIRNYYDTISADQKTKYKPRMLPLDICLACSALGPSGIDADYNWNPLYQPTPAEEAQVAFQKAQTTQIYVGTGILNEDALRTGVVNQLIEDDVYPGLQDAIDEFGAEPEEEPPPEEPSTPPPGFLPKGQFEPDPFKMLSAANKAKQVQKDADAFALFFDYDENEPRDEMGKWTTGGGAGAGIQKGTLKHKAVAHLLAAGPAGVTAEGLVQHLYGKPHAEAGGALSGVVKGISLAAPKAGYDFVKQGSGAGAKFSLVKKGEPPKTGDYAAVPPTMHAPTWTPPADPALPPGHSFQQSTSGYWHVINKNMDSVGFGKTKQEAVENAKGASFGFQNAVNAIGKPPEEPSPFSQEAKAAVEKIIAAPAPLVSVDDWKKTGGQAGSNPGGFYQAPTGDTYYVKTPPSEDYGRNEVLTGKLYALAGAKVPSTGLVSMGGKVAVASKLIGAEANIKTLGELEALPHKSVYNNAVKDAREDFAADAWLGNRDVVGLSKDNIVRVAMQNYRVDHGGGMRYRAQGQEKEFGPNADEFHSLRDPGINAQAASVFGSMTPAELKASIDKITKIMPAQISEAVASVYPKGTPQYDKYVKTLLDRQNYLFQEGQKLAPDPALAVSAMKSGPSREDEHLYATQQMEEEQGAAPYDVSGVTANQMEAAGYNFVSAGSTKDWFVVHPTDNSLFGKGPTKIAATNDFAAKYPDAMKFITTAGAPPIPAAPAPKPAPQWSETNLPPGWIAKPSGSNPNALSLYEGGTVYQGKVIPSGSGFSAMIGSTPKEFPSKDAAIHALVSSKYDPAAAAKKAAAQTEAQKQAQMSASQKAAQVAEQKAKLAKIAAMSDHTVEDSVKSVVSGAASGHGGVEAYINKAGEIAAKYYGPDVKPIEAAAIAAYTDGTYSGINDALRKNELSEQQFLYSKALKSGLKKMPKFNGTTTRGASISAADRAKYKVGKVMIEPGFQSTSPSKPWAGNTGWVYETQNGAHVGHLASMHGHSSEDEVIIPSHVSMKVVDYYHNGDGPVPSWVTKPGEYEHNYHMVEIKHGGGEFDDGKVV